MRGIKRAHGRPQRQVAAAVKQNVLAVVACMGHGLKDLRDRALILIGFAGAFRRSELVAITCEVVERVPQGIVVAVRRGKTDQEGQGRNVGIPYARGAVCPVKALDVAVGGGHHGGPRVQAGEPPRACVVRGVVRRGRIAGRQGPRGGGGTRPLQVRRPLPQGWPGHQRGGRGRVLLEDQGADGPRLQRHAVGGGIHCAKSTNRYPWRRCGFTA